jgi:nucleoside-diphosphate-sugar epimerase
MKIAVTGADGWLGKWICSRIEEYPKMSLVRIGYLSSINNIYSWDCTKVDSVENLSRIILGVDVVIHCAGLAHLANETPDLSYKMDLINNGGTRHVVEACHNAKVKKVTFISSISLYDFNASNMPNEETLIKPTSAYAKSKADAEMRVKQSGLDYRIVRLATLFGDGDIGNFRKLATSLKKRRFILPNNYEVLKSVLPVQLASKLIVDFSVRSDVPNRIVNLALPEGVSLQEIISAFHFVCGFPFPFKVNMNKLIFIAKIGDFILKQGINFPLTTDRLEKLSKCSVVDCSRMLKLWPEVAWPSFQESLEDSGSYYINL